MKRFRKFFASPVVRVLLGAAAGGAAFWLALREVDLAAFSGAWGLVDKGLAGFALLLSLVANLSKAARWRLLLSAGRPAPRVWKTLRLFFSGQLANILIPGRVGDLGRAFGMGGPGTGTTFALGTVVIEKTIDALLYAVVVAALLAFSPLPVWLQRPAYFLLLIGALAALVGIWLLRRRTTLDRLIQRVTARLPERFGSRLQAHIDAGLSSLDVFRRRGQVGRILFWTILTWGTSFLVNHYGLRAFGISLPLTAPLLLMVVLQVGFSFLVTPAAVGVFEYLCVLTLSVYAVAVTESFAFAVLLHAIALAPVLIGGSAALIYFGFDRRGTAASSSGAG